MQPLNHHQLIDFAASFGMALGGLGILGIAALAPFALPERMAVASLGATLLILSVTLL